MTERSRASFVVSSGWKLTINSITWCVSI